MSINDCIYSSFLPILVILSPVPDSLSASFAVWIWPRLAPLATIQIPAAPPTTIRPQNAVTSAPTSTPFQNLFFPSLSSNFNFSCSVPILSPGNTAPGKLYADALCEMQNLSAKACFPKTPDLPARSYPEPQWKQEMAVLSVLSYKISPRYTFLYVHRLRMPFSCSDSAVNNPGFPYISCTLRPSAQS